MSWPQDKKARRGFTLVELMVALTILAGLLAVTYSGFRVALTFWEKGNLRAQEFERRQTVLSVLREQIAGALPVLHLAQDGNVRRQKLAFEGDSRTIRFVSRTSWRDGSDAVPRWIGLSWNGRLNVDEWEMLSPSNGPGEKSIWHLELDSFDALEFRFLRRAYPNRKEEWLKVWDTAANGLPAAIALQYTIKGEAASLVLPLAYAPANWKGYQVQ